ncbi:MAG: phosphate acyltransferase PlsX [Gammaproteobacteria bacterium]|nr:phosphate acyltransferase PlsX [Gammaproteobacteria bacterium]
MNASSVVVAVDVMSGDHGIAVTVPASIDMVEADPKLRLILVGDGRSIEKELSQSRSYLAVKDRIEVRHTTEVVAMDEKPSVAMRNKKDSSMRVSINLVKEKVADASVSAGNTGALMAISRFVLKTPVGIDRPAIVFNIPSMTGHCHLLDLGANVDCSAEQLYQFGLMGSILSKAVDGISAPRVGLLNIGTEEIKGGDVIKGAADLLRADPQINYIGFVEADGIFEGEADVVACDGFAGNVALKACEGTARMFAQFIREGINQNLLTKLSGLTFLPVLSGLKKKLDPGEYNGGTMIGLRGVVIKSHGSADRASFATAIRLAALEVEKNIPHLIEDGFAEKA